MRRTEKRQLSLAQITSRSQSQMKGKSGPYISWNKEMDAALAKALIDQMKQGNKVGGQWTRHAIPAVVRELNMTLDLGLTKDNVKNRLKAWKRHYAIISDIKNQSQLMWDEGRKMVVIRSENLEAWNDYVESHPLARGYQNKFIDNWDDIALLCGKDKTTVEGAENIEDVEGAMGAEKENGVNFISNSRSLTHPSASTSDSHPLMKKARKYPLRVEEENEVNSISDSHSSTHPSASTSNLHLKKKAKKDLLADAIGEMTTSLKEYLASKIGPNRSQPKGEEVYEVVSKVPGLNRLQVFKAIRVLLNGNPEEFFLLKYLPDAEKTEWILYLISHS
ncbi:hypothetical protein ABKV19_009085 [Rosa sericea]